jgi:hypothetical protein
LAKTVEEALKESPAASGTQNTSTVALDPLIVILFVLLVISVQTAMTELYGRRTRNLRKHFDVKTSHH